MDRVPGQREDVKLVLIYHPALQNDHDFVAECPDAAHEALNPFDPRGLVSREGIGGIDVHVAANEGLGRRNILLRTCLGLRVHNVIIALRCLVFTNLDTALFICERKFRA